MKTNLLLLAGFLVAGVPALVGAQNGPGPGPGSGTSSNDYDWNHSVSNYYNNDYTWGTNCLAFSNAPAPHAWSNSYQGVIESPGQAQWQHRFGQQDLPADVQALVQQFHQDRQTLMKQLKTASDTQRQQILQEMEQMRTQLREQVCKFRDQAQQQAEQMRNRLGNNRDSILNQGAGNGSTTGRDR